MGPAGEGVAHIYQLHLQWNPLNTDTLGLLKCVLIREVSSFQGANITYLYGVGTWSSVRVSEVSFKRGSTVVHHHIHYASTATNDDIVVNNCMTYIGLHSEMI